MALNPFSRRKPFAANLSRRAVTRRITLEALEDRLAPAILIPASSAVRRDLPAVIGDGVRIELFNGIGGGSAPTHAMLTGRTPNGSTLSPVIDFPHPGAVIQVGESFNRFFADTTTPPQQVSNLSARNFILRSNFLLRVSKDLDLDTATSIIDVKLGLGSDDGFDLRVGGVSLGSAGDRGFTYSWTTVSFEAEGLYPVSLLFSANAVGQSGLEFTWTTSHGTEIVPQAALYTSPDAGDRLITFDDLPAGADVTDEYRSQGLVLQRLGGDLQVTNANPTRFVPVSPSHVYGDPQPDPTDAGSVEVTFVVPGTTEAATTDFVAFYVIDAEQTGASVTAYDPSGEVLFDQTYHGGAGTQERVVIQSSNIARVRIELGQGTDTAAIDNLAFATPVQLNHAPSIISRPVTTAAPVNIERRELVPYRSEWRYLVVGHGEGAGFESVGYDDSAFSTGSGGFGFGGGCPLNQTALSTSWPLNTDILLRKVLTLPVGATSVTIRGAIDNDVQIFLNGVDISQGFFRSSGCAQLDQFSFTALSGLVQPGENVLAVRGHDYGGVSYLDVAVTVEVAVNGTYRYDVIATDPDAGDILTYSLTTHPFGMTINDRTGVILWVPTAYDKGTNPVIVSVSDTNGATATQSYTVFVESEAPALTWTLSTTTVTEGSLLKGTLSRSGSTNGALVVSLSSDKSEQFRPPTTIIIPAGQRTSAEFSIEVINDEIIEKTETVQLTAFAPGYTQAQTSVVVEDDDLPTLTITPASASVVEGGLVTLTVTRDKVTGVPLTVKLRSSDTTEAVVDASVIIPANAASTTFQVRGVADGQSDGLQSVQITANGAYTTCGCTITTGVGTATLTVNDADTPGLRLTLGDSTLGEGYTTTATLFRNTDLSGPLTVQLAVSPVGIVSIPASVTFLAGRDTVTFTVTSVDDGRATGVRTVTITASATGLTGSSAELIVTDASGPDLTIGASAVTAPGSALTGERITVTYRVTNTGRTDARGPWFDKLYLSSDDTFSSEDTLIGTPFKFEGTVTPGLYYARSVPVTLPDTPGTYYLIAVTDAGNVLAEVAENNNTRVSGAIEVKAAYTATVSASKAVYGTGEAVGLSGTATRPNGEQATFSVVSIHIITGPFERTIAAVTDESGAFRTTWKPLPGESGRYTIGAAHPGEKTAPVQGTFNIVGVTVEGPATLSVVEGSTVGGTITLTNKTGVALTALTYEMVGLPVGVTASFTPVTTLNGAATAIVAFTLTAGSVPSDATRNATLRVRSTEGASTDVPVAVTVVNNVANLVVEPGTLTAGMIVGRQRTFEFTVTNNGSEASGALAVEPPAGASWLRSTSPAAIPSLAPGESATVSLLLSPPGDLPLTQYTGSLVVCSANGAFAQVPFRFRAVSEETGAFTVQAVDELFYFAAGSPALAGAEVIVRDVFTAEELYRGTTDADGRVTTAQLRSGYYTLEVRATDHNTATATVFVEPGETTFRQMFLSKQTVKYTWKVGTTEIQDRYKVVVESVFETNVPVPTLVIDNPVIDLADLDEVGEVMIQQMTITNVGLIAADNVKFNVGTHPFYTITPLTTDIGTLGAKQSVTIPVLVKRGATVPGGGVGELAAADTGPDNVPCAIDLSVGWDYICGIPIPRITAIAVINVDGNCPASPPSPGGGGGTTNPSGGFSVGTPISVTPAEPCECVEFTLFSLDLTSYIKEPIELLEEKINGKLGKFVTLELNPEATADATVCCDDNDGFGIEFSAAAKVNPTISLGPKYEYRGGDFDVSLPDGGQLSFSGFTATFDFNSFVGVGLGGSITSGCNFDEPHATLSGSVNIGIRGGVTAQVKVEKTGLLPFEFAIVDVSFKLEGETTGTVTYDSRTGLSYCVESTGLYIEAFATTVFGYEWYPLDDPATPEKETRYYIVNPAFLGDCGDVGASELRASVESQNNLLLSLAAQGRAESVPVIQAEDVCATVRLQIEQEIILTRTAVEAELGIENSSLNPINNLQFQITVYDTDGNDVTSRFQVRTPELSGITGVNGDGTLAGGTSGTARWILLPTDDAAPTGSTEYRVGGYLYYTQEGNQVAVPFQPVAVTVLPNPQLTLNYFHQRDVFADDPFTDVVEPSQPYTLAVLVKNDGKGDARNLTITSAQPKIVENEKGLLVDFKIIGTEVAGQNLSPSLTANFGNIAAGESAIGQWLFTSSLQGRFIDYSATFEHIDGLGDERLSIVKSVAIHELIHVVNAGENGDTRPDFLTNEDRDEAGTPDHLWFSDGTNTAVNIADFADVTGTGESRTLTASMPTGWGYLSDVIPTDPRYRLVKAVRPDGSEIPVGPNLWVTDRTWNERTKRPVDETRIHLLDKDGPDSYTLVFELVTLPPVAVQQVGQPTPAQRTTALDHVDVTFSREINAATLDAADLALTLDDTPVEIVGALTIESQGGSTYRISGLAASTAGYGDYVLTVSSAGVLDEYGNSGAVGSIFTSWTMGERAPYVTIVRGVTPGSLVNRPVDYLEVNFSFPVAPDSFTVADLALTRNGGPNLLDGAEDVVIVRLAPSRPALDDQPTDPSIRFRIDGLTPYTTLDGSYTLTVFAIGVATSGGTPGVGTYALTWTNDATAPFAPESVEFAPVAGTAGFVTGTVSESNLRVLLQDAVTGRDLGEAVVTGTTFTASIDFVTPGAHRLRAVAVDPAGGESAPAEKDIFIDLTPPVVVGITGQPSTPSSEAVDELLVEFSEPIVVPSPAGFRLTHNGGADLLSGSGVIVTAINATTIKLSGLSALSALPGVYSFTVLAGGITDIAGNGLAEDFTVTWGNRPAVTETDTTPPISSVELLPAVAGPSFLVTWSGTDTESGIASFDVFVSVDGGDYTAWMTATQLTAAVFTGELGRQYAFYTRAVDNAGNREEAPSEPDAVTTVRGGGIRGVLFHDINGDGVMQGNEKPLQYWTVFLDLDQDGKLDPGEPTSITTATGVYAFSNLVPGTYAVVARLPAGWMTTTQAGGGTTGSSQSVSVSAYSTAAVNASGITQAATLIGLDQFRSDTRYAGIDGSGEAVVILDTGIDRDHAFYGPDADGDGIADSIIYQWDYVEGDADASDENGHGTHIAGIIGSRDQEYAGIAPGTNFIILRVLDAQGNGTFARIEQALQWVVAHAREYGVSTVNLSFTDGGAYIDAGSRYGIGDELAALNSLGVIVVAAGGNGYGPAGVQGVGAPAADPNTIAVGALWSQDAGGPFSWRSGGSDETTGAGRVTSFSQRGPGIDVFAPGTLIPNAGLNGSVRTLSGTSMAAAEVSGVAALVQQLARQILGRTLSTTEFRTLLQRTSTLFFDGDDENDNVPNSYQTYGRLDVLALAEAIQSLPSLPTLDSVADQELTGQGVSLTVATEGQITVTPGTIVAGLRLGIFRLGQLSGLVFNDSNGNGRRDPGESAVVGRTVYIDANNNKQWDATELRTVTTAAGFVFTNLGPITGTLREILPNGSYSTVVAGVHVTSGLNQKGIQLGSRKGELPRVITNTGLRLSKGSRVALTINALRVIDPDRVYGEITFKITSIPMHGVLLRGTTRMTVDMTFTQNDINLGRMVYQHNGSETTIDRFTFSTSDTTNGVLERTVVNITINAAPELIGSGRNFTSITENSTNHRGNTVADLLGSSFRDKNAGSLSGIAVIATTGSGKGRWQYSLDSGATWREMGAVSPGSARLLRDNDRLRFVPAAQFHGRVSMTYQAWDRTFGAVGDRVNLSFPTAVGGSTAFSIQTTVAQLTINAVNDAPRLNPAARPTVARDYLGSTVASLLIASGATDVDGGTANLGIAVIAVSGAEYGFWQYSTDNGGTWKNSQNVSANQALLLTARTRVRFMPTTWYTGNPTLQFRAWDQSQGLAGTKANLGSPTSIGGTTAFSEEAPLAIIAPTTDFFGIGGFRFFGLLFGRRG